MRIANIIFICMYNLLITLKLLLMILINGTSASVVPRRPMRVGTDGATLAPTRLSGTNWNIYDRYTHNHQRYYILQNYKKKRISQILFVTKRKKKKHVVLPQHAEIIKITARIVNFSGTPLCQLVPRLWDLLGASGRSGVGYESPSRGFVLID